MCINYTLAKFTRVSVAEQNLQSRSRANSSQCRATLENIFVFSNRPRGATVIVPSKDQLRQTLREGRYQSIAFLFLVSQLYSLPLASSSCALSCRAFSRVSDWEKKEKTAGERDKGRRCGKENKSEDVSSILFTAKACASKTNHPSQKRRSPAHCCYAPGGPCCVLLNLSVALSCT